MKKIKVSSFIITVGIFLFFSNTIIFAQEFSSARNEQIIALLSQLEKNKAIEEGFKRAQEIMESEEVSKEKFSQLKLIRHLHPYLEIENTYNHNIFLLPAKKYDYINTSTPGIKFSLSKEDTLLELDLGTRFTSYLKHSSLNSQNPYISFVLKHYFSHYHFNLYDKFRDDIFLNSDITEGTEGVVDYRANDFDMSLGAEYNRLAFDLGFRRYDYFYEQDYKQENNYNENIFSITGYINLAPKSKLLFEYDHGIILYTEEPHPSKNANYHQSWFGLKGEITSKITGIMKAGYQYRIYRSRADWNKPVLGIDLHYQFKERTAFLLKLEKTAKQSINVNQNYYDTVIMDLGIVNNFAFNPKLNLRLNGFYQDDEYVGTQPSREDKLYGLTSALQYGLKRWLYTALEYTYKERDSNIDANDYVNHILSLKLKGSF
ncbi:MAG: outer membrane beta-barrel protein [Candidatus Omnitrophica bacterium]|nr:outer membrane beta-barrel protein [Candidatus Omnitrophota bacterium]